MRLRQDEAIEVKSPAQLAIMREAGLVTAAALRAAVAAVEPGISTAELDAIAEREIRAAGAIPSFLGYHGYPATICASVNDQIVHGIPRPDQILRAGDVISVDCGAIVDGWHGDAAVTVRVPAATSDHPPAPSGPAYRDDEVAGLLDACEDALWHGLAQAAPGGRLTDISSAIEQAARAAGPYGIVREYTGHGIGTRMHMDPPVPNYGRAGRGPVLSAGMTLAVEPMLVLGRPETRLLEDDWTVVTADGSWAAHFEHTVAITEAGPWVLTSEDGGVSMFARLRAGRRAAGDTPGGSAAGEVAAAMVGAASCTTGTASEGARHGL
jgi:methionyl aminopeptidase